MINKKEKHKQLHNDTKFVNLSLFNYREYFGTYGHDNTSIVGLNYEFIWTNHYDNGFMMSDEFTHKSSCCSETKVESVYSSK